METYRLVLTEDLNQFGYLFGGRLLRWVDEASWISATLDYPQCKFVTVGMDQVSFKKQICKGDIISIHSNREKTGETSVGYRVEVYRGKVNTGEVLFSTCVTFVNVDDAGHKQSIC